MVHMENILVHTDGQVSFLEPDWGRGDHDENVQNNKQINTSAVLVQLIGGGIIASRHLTNQTETETLRG